MPGDRQRSLDAGMDDCIAEPVSPSDLALMLQRWVGQAKAR